VDVAFQGRLDVLQNLLSRIKISIRGTGASPQYQLKIYAEGSGAVAVYDSGLLAAPGTLTETLLTDLDLSSQPTGDKRYHVVVEVTIDSGETVEITRPFVRQE
jgi:hypothetical protein